jgi:hypothetical protein
VGAWVFDCLWQLMNACAFLCGGGSYLLWVLFEVLVYVLNNLCLLMICYISGCRVDGVVSVLVRWEREKERRERDNRRHERERVFFSFFFQFNKATDRCSRTSY